MHSNIVGYAWPIEDTKQVVYVTSDDHIHEMVGQGSRWRDTDPTLTASAPTVPLETAIMTGYTWPKGRTKQIAYVSPVEGSRHIHELVLREGSTWSYADLMDQPMAAPAADGNAIVGYSWKANGTKQVVYISGIGHVHELAVGTVGMWKHSDLTQEVNAPLVEGDALAAYAWEAGGTKQVAYISGDGHVHELASGTDGIWKHTDLTDLTNAPAADEGSVLAGYGWETGGTKQVVYTGNGGRIYELTASKDGSWTYVDLLEQTNAPLVDGSALAAYAWETGLTKQVVYVSEDGHVQELTAGTDGKWSHTDLTRLINVPVAASDVIVGYEWPSQFAKQVVYLDTGENPRIHELMLQHGSSWEHTDLTTRTGAQDIV